MIVYRITNSVHASDISGSGASLYPGRWNKKGTPVLYTGGSKEIALLEQIVHIPPLLIPNLDILTIEIPENSITELNPNNLPKNWKQYPAPTVLSEIGHKWIISNSSIVLCVPSCILESSTIYILNCNHAKYGDVKILDQRRFQLDKRFIKTK